MADEAQWTQVLDSLGADAKPSIFTKYKNLGDFMKGVGELNKLASGKPHGVVPPTSADDPNVKAWREALGVPDTVDGYGVVKPDDLPENVPWDDGQIGAFLDVLHRHHAPPGLVKELLSTNLQLTGESVTQAMREQERSDEASLKAEHTKLMDEHGSSLPTVLDKAKRAAAAIGLDPANNPLFNSAENVNAFAKIAEMVGEDALPATITDRVTQNYEEAQRIMTDPTHPKYRLYYEGDERVNAEVREGLARAGSR